MNKAFIREPEFDGRAYCPRCGSVGEAVGEATLDHHIRPEARGHLGDSAWFCSFAKCEAAYFDLLERVVTVAELQQAVYPKDPSAPVCACFGFGRDEIDADVAERSPTRIRELLAKSKSSDARCAVLAADGQCCMAEVQRLYIRGVSAE
ncbi:MAG: hypothetical protein KY475_12505 [Planctomycetes bacterium]|nr:hypothetical protein [Planctomycetota bacterium]